VVSPAGASQSIRRRNAMNDQTDDIDLTDDDILAYTISDEALEATAGSEMIA
jgi:hypothetical protein